LQQAGFTLCGTNVQMQRHFMMAMMSKARNQWTITSRNPERKLIIGGRYILFGHVSLPPNYCDVKLNAKMPGAPETCQNLIKLSQ
jgi:trimethylamine--corrinoid protein Co-methyltransferase